MNKSSLILTLFLIVSGVVSVTASNASFVDIKADTYTMQNNVMSIKFQKINNKLKLINLYTDKKQWITNESVDTDLLWQLSFVSDKNRSLVFNSQMLNLKDVEMLNTDKKGLKFQWEFKSEASVGYVNVTVGLDEKTKLSEWELSVDLPEGWEVTDAIFPVISVNKDKGAQLITPSGWGAEYELDNISNLRLPLIYPSSRATVQLYCMKDKDEVLYFSTHDKNANTKTLSARIGNNVELSVEVPASKGWNKTGKFNIPWKTSIGLHQKGWENAVLDWYRPFATETVWGKKTMLEKNTPEWMLKTDLWLHGGRDGNDELDALQRSFDFFGKENISYHWYYWSSKDFDTSYPEYLPARANYDKIVDIIHQNGSHVMPYTNGRLWDTTTVIYQEKKGLNEVVLKKNGQPYVEIYASKAPNAVVCPSSKVWNDIVVKFTKDILEGKIKNDALYYDQVASARALPCYNSEHNHPAGGGDFWHYANRDIFTNVRNQLQANKVLATEQNAECFIDLFDLFLMGNRPMGKEWSPAPVFPLIYSDRAMLYGFYLHNPNDMSFRIKNALTLLWGAQLNGGRSLFVMSAKVQENAAFLRDMMEFRKKQHDLFVGGRFLGEYTPEGDNPILTIESWVRPSQAVRGAKWQSADGKKATLLVNFDTANHNIVLPNGKKVLLKAGQCYRFNH